MSTPPNLLSTLQETWPHERWGETRIVVAVSGGADSVALLRGLITLATDSRRLHVAHFNHGWRGQESDADEHFVVQLCRDLGVECSTGRDTTTEAAARSEQAARKARYRFLRDIARNQSASHIVTAHTASDRVETMLHNLCRGTGLAGVCTPAVYRTLDESTMLVRPLVHCFREEVIEYLASLSQEFRQDSSNHNQSYRRNFLRHSVLPVLRQAYGDSVDQRLLSFSQLAEQTLQVQRSLAQQYWTQAHKLELEKIGQGWLPDTSNELRLPAASLLPSPWPIVLLALQQAWQAQGWKQQPMTRQHWQRLRKRWEEIQPPTKLHPRQPRSLFQLPGKIQASSLQGWLILSEMKP